MSDLKKLMVREIKYLGWLDYSYQRGDDFAGNFVNVFGDLGYLFWLESLPDQDFLAAYNRVRDAERELE